MDYRTLLALASQNQRQISNKTCYQTKFQTLDKTDQDKTLSENIKKFLVLKAEEDRKKTEERNKRRINLLALRDQKTHNRIKKHLKVCKAANKSVLLDAVDTEVIDSSQYDFDDYGYVSQEATAFHNKLLDKYRFLPNENLLPNNDGKRTVRNIASTKHRVRQAPKQQKLEESLPHISKRKWSDSDCKRLGETDEMGRKKESLSGNRARESEEKQPSKKKTPPPQMNYQQLLQLAERNQYELKQNPCNTINPTEKNSVTNQSREKRNCSTNIPVQKDRPDERSSRVVDKKNIINIKSVEKDSITAERRKLDEERKALEELRHSIEEEKKKMLLTATKIMDKKSKVSSISIPSSSVKSRPRRPVDVKLRLLLHADIKKRQITPTNVKPRQLSPTDVRLEKPKPSKLKVHKRRIYDDSDEYDSEMDDFIVGGAEDQSENYSKYIKEIFGYDKNKYKDFDNDDDAAMESNYAQQLKEECISTKIG